MAHLPHHTFIYRVCIVHSRDIIGHKFMLILLTQTRELGHCIKCLTRFGETINGPRQANLVLIAYASSEGSGEPAHPRSLARTFAARSYKQ